MDVRKLLTVLLLLALVSGLVLAQESARPAKAMAKPAAGATAQAGAPTAAAPAKRKLHPRRRGAAALSAPQSVDRVDRVVPPASRQADTPPAPSAQESRTDAAPLPAGGMAQWGDLKMLV